MDELKQQEKRDLLMKIAREKRKAKRSKNPKPKDEIDRAMTRFARRLDELNTDRERACENCVYYYPDTRYCSVRRINPSPKDHRPQCFIGQKSGNTTEQCRKGCATVPTA